MSITGTVVNALTTDKGLRVLFIEDETLRRSVLTVLPLLETRVRRELARNGGPSNIKVQATVTPQNVLTGYTILPQEATSDVNSQ